MKKKTTHTNSQTVDNTEDVYLAFLKDMTTAYRKLLKSVPYSKVSKVSNACTQAVLAITECEQPQEEDKKYRAGGGLPAWMR